MKKSELIAIIKEEAAQVLTWDSLPLERKRSIIRQLTTGELTKSIPGIGQVFWQDDVGMSLEQFKKDYRSDPRGALKIIDDLYLTKAAEQPGALDNAFAYADADISKDIDRDFGQETTIAANSELSDEVPDLGEPEDLHTIANKYLRSKIEASIEKNIEKIAMGRNRDLTDSEKLRVRAKVEKYYNKYTDGATLVDDPVTGTKRVVFISGNGEKLKGPPHSKLAVASRGYIEKMPVREQKEKSENDIILENHKKGREVHPAARNNWQQNA